MDDFLKTAFASGIASVSVLAVCFFILKNALTEWIKSLFAQQLEDLRQEHRIEFERDRTFFSTREKARDRFLERQAEAFGLLADLVYRCRNLSRELLNSDGAKDWAPTLELLSRDKNELVKAVYRQRLLYDDGLFELLHRFKEDVTAFEMTCQLAANEIVSESALKHGLERLYARIDERYPLLIRELRGRLLVEDLGES